MSEEKKTAEINKKSTDPNLRANSEGPEELYWDTALGFEKGSDEIIVIKLTQHIEKPQ